MYRTQILLDPKQRGKLEEIAKREARSISSVTRRMIDIGLTGLEDEGKIWDQRTRVLDELRAGREMQGKELRGEWKVEADRT
jgi:hypothetical protein